MTHACETEEFTEDLKRALSAAHYSMDYFLLRIILDTSKQATQASKKDNHKLCSYIVNQGLWDIGIYIQNKTKKYSFLSSTFFDDMANNASKYLNLKNSLAFSSENFKRCFKLVELANKEWFDLIANSVSWEKIAYALDQANSFNELKSLMSLQI